MITPMDIHNKTFSKQIRGYSSEEVNSFLEELAGDYERIYREHREMEEEMDAIKTKLRNYEKMEETMSSTLVMAQQTAENVKRNANKEAELSIREAQNEARKIVSDAEAARRKMNADLLKTEGDMNLYIEKLLSNFKSALSLIESAKAAQAPQPIQPAPQPFMSTPAAPVEPVAAPAVEKEPAPAPAAEPKAAVPDIPESPAPADEELPPPPDEPPVAEAAPLPWDEPTAPVTAPVPPVPEERPVESTAPAAPAPEYTADPALSRPRKVAAEGINPFEQWSEVVKLLQEKDPMLHSYLRKSKAYFDGTRVLIDGGKTFRDFIRVNKDSQRLIKKLIAQVSGVAVPIGPYEPRTAAKHTSNAEQSLHALEKLGLDVSIEDSAKKKYKQ